MRINLNSWHYKVMDFCHVAVGGESMWSKDRPKSLCSYFWSFWGKLFHFIFVYSIITTVALGLPISAWSFFHNHSPSAKGVFTIYIVVGTLIGSIVLIAKLNRELRRKANIRRNKGLPGLTLFGTFIEYLRSVKTKACPRIEYFND